MHQHRSIRFLALSVAMCFACVTVVAVDLPAIDSPPDGSASDQVPASESEPIARPAKAAMDDQPPQRVILYVNRNLTVMGHLQLEDDDVIVVRNLRGEIQSYPKVRVLQIVRLVEPQPGQRGVVFLQNGQQREGVIIEDTFDHVLVEIEGIPARLRREFVDHVVLEPTFDQKYEQFRAALRPNMIDQHIALCRWLIEQRQYELAHENLQEILSKHENHDARRLLHLVNAQLALQTQPAPRTSSSSSTGPSEASRLPSRLLTAEEVNLIRVYEVDFDHPPRLTVQPSTVRRLFELYGTHEAVPATQTERNAMVRGDSAQIVRLMFELRARELYPEIQVNTEPHSLNLFRLRVHNTWLLNNCATSGCHGGPDAGDLYLHRRNHTDDRVRYTNFMILEQLDVDPQWPLINYEDPEMSLIVQYGLPREAARLPHPDVRGWSPVFARSNDRMKQDTIRWIKSMMQPRPTYPVEFDPRPRIAEPVELAEERESAEPSR